MHAIKFVALCLVFTANGFAHACPEDNASTDRGGRDHGRGRGRGEVSGRCSLPPSYCGSSSGRQGELRACSITCYHNASAVCTPGQFGDQCAVDEENTCECVGGD